MPSNTLSPSTADRLRIVLAIATPRGAVGEHFVALRDELARRGHSVATVWAHSIPTGSAPDTNYRWPSPRPVHLTDFGFSLRLMRRTRPHCAIGQFGATNIMAIASWMCRVPVRISWYHTTDSQIAMLCGATDDQQAALTEYGIHIGLAFQIADDILDVVGDEQKIGKPVGSDEKQDKATYPKFYGIDESRAMRVRFTWWPFHPLAYAVTSAWEMNLVWMPLFIACMSARRPAASTSPCAACGSSSWS